ncbi:TolC family protein [Pedobacter sp.]|uniref:TolC family protein n=1 Tax=Pedobacter sp. TaxID=1411316 RepID=UPI003D7F1E40
MITNTIKLSCVILLLPCLVYAQQPKKLSINEAVNLGIANSKNLKLSQNKIEEAQAQLRMVKDNALPTAKATFLFNHVEIPTHQLSIDGATALQLPNRSSAFAGTAGIEQLVYGGGKLKYAEESTRLLTEVALLDADKNKEEVSYAVINTYYALFKVMQSKKVVAQNLEVIDAQIKQAQRFFDQGIVTKNDVLRFQLQQANVALSELELESNRKIINYNLDILLGLPEDTEVEIVEPEQLMKPAEPITVYLNMAIENRQELKQLDLQSQVAAVNVKSIKANTLPTLGVGANAYYINPNGHFIPQSNEFIAPMTVGATLSWNIGTLWTNGNKVSEAKVQQKGVSLQKDVVFDQVKTEVNANYHKYLLSTNKISILKTSIEQATENDKLLASKYKNNVASAIDRIDAETLLYQSKINLEIAKADAGLAYYTLLKSTGKITP